jgi:hypothetical protein
MTEAIEVAIYEGKILCGFPTRNECKDYIKKQYPNLDPFDVVIQTQYLTTNNPYTGPVPR